MTTTNSTTDYSMVRQFGVDCCVFRDSRGGLHAGRLSAVESMALPPVVVDVMRA